MAKKIRLGLIGLGYIGKIHLLGARSAPLCLTDPPVDVQYVSLLSTHPEENRAYAESLGFETVHGDLDKFLDQGLDGVDICTPNSMHFPQAKAALERGIPVYCEKPMTMDAKEARALVDLAAASGVANQVALTYRFHPSSLRAKAYVESGVIGDIIAVRGHLFHSSYLDRDRPTSWRLQNSFSGGGALADLGIHILDQMLYLAGDVSSLRAFERTFIQDRPVAKGAGDRIPVDVDDWALVEMEFKSGASGTLEASRVYSGRDGSSLEVFGTKGSLVIAGGDSAWPTLHLSEGETTYRGKRVELDAAKREILSLHPNAKMTVGGMVDAHMTSLLRFGLAISRKETVYPGAPDFAAGLKCQEVLDAAYRSAGRGGERVQI